MLTVSVPPHINANRTINVFMFDTIIALLPAVAFCSYILGAGTLFLGLIAVASCITADILCSIFSGKKTVTVDLSVIITGLIFSLAVAVSIPVWAAALGCALSVVVGREIFGGTGMNTFNPALIGIILLQLIMPVNAQSVVSAAGRTVSLALFAGALYLLMRGNINAVTTIAFVASYSLSGFLFKMISGSDGIYQLFNGNFFLGALFLVNDPVTTPITKKGKTTFGIICGSLSLLIGVFYSVLVANMLTPLMDEILKPRRFGAV